jgi:outer membrane protein assembly factor BamB
MKTLVTIVTILFATLSYSQSLLETIDLPPGDFYNYGYGLVYNGGKYWISSSSSNAGMGLIKAVDNTGTEVDQITINYPGMQESQGLVFDGTNFWYVDRKTARCDIFKVAPDGAVLDSITTSQLFGGSKYLGGAGWDGTGLWISLYYPNTEAALYKIDINTKTIVDTIPTFGEQPQGITVKGDTLFYVMDDNDGDDERVFAVDLATQDTLFSFHVPDQSSQSPRGLAWDATYFWLLAEPVGGSLNERQLFKYELGGSGTPQIFIPLSELYFPNTTVGTDTSAVLQIFNNGSAPLSVDSINISGSVFSFDPLSFPINIIPGNSVNVTVRFTPLDYQSYNGLAYVYSNDPVNPVVQVSLTGQGVLDGPTIGLTANSHSFGNVWVGEEGLAFWKFEIFNMGDESLEISGMNFSLPEFTYSSPSIPFIIPSTDTTEITIYFYPTQAIAYEDTLKINSSNAINPLTCVSVNGTGIFDEYNYGYTFWNYVVPLNPNSSSSYQETRVEGLKPINDITGDGINEVIISTDNYLTICLDGAASGNSFPIWTFNTYFNNSNAGSIGQSWDYGVQDAIQIADDLNGDGYNDVVIGTGGGNEHVYAIDGTNGEIIWEFGDNINYGLGDFEAVDVKRDFNGDNVEDVLAIADANDAGTGYHSAYLFNGVNGDIIWQYYYPGPSLAFGKSIISINDITEDNIPDAIISYGNNGSSNMSVQGLNGTNGNVLWTTDMEDDKAKELLELPLPGDSSDVIAAEFFGRIHRLNGRTGAEVWEYPLGASAAVIQMALIKDLNSDDIPDVLIASFANNGLNCLSGADGVLLWAYPMEFQYGVASVPDIDFDGADDVITGDQTGTFYCISGRGDSLIFSYNFPGDRINTVNVMPSIDGNYSYELLAGTKGEAGTFSGKVACFSGGVDTVSTNLISKEARPENFELYQNYPNPFNPATKIRFTISELQLTSLKVYDILGREVSKLVDEELPAGNYEIEFDASPLSSGIYFYTLNAGEFVETKKMILLK